MRAAAGRESTLSSDDDCDEDIPAPQPISTSKALDYIAALKDVVFVRGLSEEHANHLDSLGKTVVCTTVRKQATITMLLQ